MKLLKAGLHLWITLTSILSFLFGWILLVHAPKPVQASSANSALAEPWPTLAPLAPLSDFNSTGNDMQDAPVFSLLPQARSRFHPFAFVTGGS